MNATNPISETKSTSDKHNNSNYYDNSGGGSGNKKDNNVNYSEEIFIDDKDLANHIKASRVNFIIHSMG